jgi:hypothetical protein
MSGGIGSVTDARLTMLAFAVTNWLIVWFLRFLPTPIKNPLIKVSIQLLLAITLSGAATGQVRVYRSLSEIRVLENDHFFMVAFIMEYAIGACILFASAFERRRRERNQGPTN